LLESLQKWQKEAEDELGKEDRKKLKVAVDKWRVWAAVTAILLGIVGLGGVASFWQVYESMKARYTEAEGRLKQRVEDSLKVAEAKLANHSILTDEALKNANEKVKEIVSEQSLRDLALKTITTKFREEIAGDLQDAFLTHVVGMASGAKADLDLQQHHAPDVRLLNSDPRKLKELSYQIDALLEQYKTQLATGNMSLSRRESFVFVVNAIVDRGRGYDGRAEDWLKLAIRTDPSLPEARTMLARLFVDNTEYQGQGKWNNPAKRKQAIDLLKDPATTQAIQSHLEVARTMPLLQELEREFDGAADAALRQIRIEMDSRGESDVDPRLFYRLGNARLHSYFDKSSSPHCGSLEPLRIATAEAYLDALKHDPEYLKAANNYLWVSTHRNADDSLIDLGDTKDQATTELRKRLDEFRNEPLTRHYPTLLNTIAEACASLASDADSCQRAIQYADQSVEEGNLHELSNAMKTLLILRQDVVRKMVTSKACYKQTKADK
jgi:hypothetical protein